MATKPIRTKQKKVLDKKLTQSSTQKEKEASTTESSALDVQVGGGHYKDMVIQPIEFIHKNNLNFCQGNIIKYTTRYKSKGGMEDLKKVKHYVDLLIELEYGKE